MLLKPAGDRHSHVDRFTEAFTPHKDCTPHENFKLHENDVKVVIALNAP